MSNPPSLAGPSSQMTDTSAFRSRYVIPSDLYILPPAAGALGVLIGMIRGGRRARLRFLAENAHRKPTTSKGWYFYMKTRNYKVMFEASRVGARTGLALGAVTGSYVVLEEGVSYLREQYLGIISPRGGNGEGFRDRTTWRKGGEVWWDGVVAGGILGAGVGLLWRLPTQLVGRCIFYGTVLGATRTSMKSFEGRLGERIRADQLAKKEAGKVDSDTHLSSFSSLPSSPSTTGSMPLEPSSFETSSFGTSQSLNRAAEIVPAEKRLSRESNHPLVDRNVHPGESASFGFDDVAAANQEKSSWWSTAKGLFGRS